MSKHFIPVGRFNVRAGFILAMLLLAAGASAQIADGDRHFNQRAAGAEHIDAAIAAFQRAVAAEPNNLEGHWKLMRALRFKGAYRVNGAEEKKKVYGVAKTVGEKALAAVEKRLGVTAKTPEKQVADAAKGVPGAAEIYLWDAVNWGEWALAYGKMAAARQGAADRIRRNATIAMLAAPGLEAGAPSRVLGRLHDQTPRIPFITGWASQKEALKFLNESLKIDPSNKLTLVFLAEAMVADSASKKPQAIEMLRKVVAAPNHPDYLVEDAAATADAQALLKKWGG